MGNLILILGLNPLLTNDAYMHHELHKPVRIYMGRLILGVNTLYRVYCYFKLLPMVGKGLIHVLCTGFTELFAMAGKRYRYRETQSDLANWWLL